MANELQRGAFVGGRFVPVLRPEGEIDLPSPSDLADHPGPFPWSLDAARAAVAAARAAQPAWEAAGPEARAEALRRLQKAFERRAEELARAIAREVGKPLWEARGEAAALAAKVELTLGAGLDQVRVQRPAGVRGEWRYRPHGVMAVIGPFNFPAHLPNGHVIPALALGNAVVMKASELTPAVGAVYAACVEEAALPPGVFNLVQGARTVGELLSSEAEVDGVLFTGSVAVGSAIARANSARPGKILALELGGKNAAIVCEDADVGQAARDVAYGAFVTAGQRCSSTSRCVVHRSLLDPFLTKLSALARGIRVGHWEDPEVFSGPLVSAGALERFLLALRSAPGEGAEPIVAPELAETARAGHYLRPSIHLVRRRLVESRYQRDELFGPDVAIYPVESDDEALAVANDSRYGLCASVFTKSHERFERIAARLRAGIVNENQPTVGAAGRLPFGGVGDSGNQRPAGILASLYCAWPQAVSYGEAGSAVKPVPGFPAAG